MASLETLQAELAAARAARLSILENGQSMGYGSRQLADADLAEINRTIRTLEQQIAALRQASRGLGSLVGRVIRPGGSC